MKQKSRFSCLAVLFAVIAALLPATAHSQVHYRGFVETGAGFNSHIDYETGFTAILTTTHGIQLNRSFIGVGAGIQPGLLDTDSYESFSFLGIPLFLAYRYDAFNTTKINFYGAANLGCLFPVCNEFNNDAELYAKLGGGIRQRISDRFGLSYGLHYYIAYSSNDELNNMGVLLSIGLDF
jgi:hypothetical protein